MKIAFVILHYEGLEDTKECLASLQKYINQHDKRNNDNVKGCERKSGADKSSESDKIEIVVVDNGSVNGKLSQIEDDYKDTDSIHFLYSSQNLGFAKGNNIGFAYAKNVLKAEIILLCNNDLVFKDDEFVEKLVRSYQQDKYDVAGPKTISLVDGKNQNPIPYQYPRIKDVDVRIIKSQILYWLSFIGLDVWLQKIVSKEITEFHPEENEEYQLFGACLIFTKRYIDLFDGLYDGTFMYGEESILKERVIDHSLKMQYLDMLEVYHKEGSSTGVKYGQGKRKRQFYYRWSIHSCRLLKKMKEEKGES